MPSQFHPSEEVAGLKSQIHMSFKMTKSRAYRVAGKIPRVGPFPPMSPIRGALCSLKPANLRCMTTSFSTVLGLVSEVVFGGRGGGGCYRGIARELWSTLWGSIISGNSLHMHTQSYLEERRKKKVRQLLARFDIKHNIHKRKKKQERTKREQKKKEVGRKKSEQKKKVNNKRSPVPSAAQM